MFALPVLTLAKAPFEPSIYEEDQVDDLVGDVLRAQGDLAAALKS